jgi:transcriptional regulator with PAS, ATPase and Fis domain
MNKSLAGIIECKGFGVLLFDVNLHVTHINAAGAQMFRAAGAEQHQGKHLQDLFPELVGVEDQLDRILTRKESTYSLEYVNRRNDKGRTLYWDLLLLADPETGLGMLILEDVTEKATAILAANQQRYDHYLYHHSISHRQNQIYTWMKGESTHIREIINTILKVSQVPGATVLLMGETGTGKNLTARMIHESSMAVDSPFVEINCAALPEHLIEAELFGYEKGAFTHAVTAKPGLLEEAHDGTLFLDEIGELPLNMQAKMLSVMDSKQFRRLGGTKTRTVNVRIIAATNRDLQSEIAAKRFREDLFYRLNVVCITMPPLRALGKDMLLIAEHFVKLFNIEFKKTVQGFTRQARKAILDHPWPGNVRELNNCIERAMIFIEGDKIGPADLVMLPPAKSADSVEHSCWVVPSAGIDLENVERRLILSALEQAQDNKSKAARLLGLTRHTLRYRMEKHGLS